MSTAAEKRYATRLRIWDNGGRSFDRFTILPPRTARACRESNGLWEAIGASERPFHPQGFGQYTSAAPGSHLGKRINWAALPPDVQQFARQVFPEYAPANA